MAWSLFVMLSYYTEQVSTSHELLVLCDCVLVAAFGLIVERGWNGEEAAQCETSAVWGACMYGTVLYRCAVLACSCSTRPQLYTAY